MAFQDKTLVCKDCGKEFVFTAGEQEFYQTKGFTNEPLRCPECRKARKMVRRQNRTMYPIICSACGKEDKVPFDPKGKDALCWACFQAKRGQKQEEPTV